MIFELTADAVAARDTARAFAQTVLGHAAEIDRAAAIPTEITQEARSLVFDDPLVTVVTSEEIGAASAAAAIAIATRSQTARPLGLAGLRGAHAPDDSSVAQLVLAAVALGVGRAAVEAALADVRHSATAATGEEKPQWVVADVATDLDAARLLVYKAAGTMAKADIALARLLASAAAHRAVDTALRVAGSSALVEGSALERLSRDVRVLSVLLGTEENLRAIAAETLLPR